MRAINTSDAWPPTEFTAPTIVCTVQVTARCRHSKHPPNILMYILQAAPAFEKLPSFRSVDEHDPLHGDPYEQTFSLPLIARVVHN